MSALWVAWGTIALLIVGVRIGHHIGYRDGHEDGLRERRGGSGLEQHVR